MNSHFDSYRDHEVVDFAKELRTKKGISYYAVVRMAIALDNDLNPIIDFSHSTPGERWNKGDATKFVRLLKRFYKDTECEKFFEQNQELFNEVERRFVHVYQNIDLNWYNSFFGVKAGQDFTLILSLGSGGHNYGPSLISPQSKKEIFAIMGTWRVDESGMPEYNAEEYLPYIIHEFAHSFANPLLENSHIDFKESGMRIFETVKYQMSEQQAYGHWQIMLNEALVRASVIKYFQDHGEEQSQIQIM